MLLGNLQPKSGRSGAPSRAVASESYQDKKGNSIGVHDMMTITEQHRTNSGWMGASTRCVEEDPWIQLGLECLLFCRHAETRVVMWKGRDDHAAKGISFEKSQEKNRLTFSAPRLTAGGLALLFRGVAKLLNESFHKASRSSKVQPFRYQGDPKMYRLVCIGILFVEQYDEGEMLARSQSCPPYLSGSTVAGRMEEWQIGGRELGGTGGGVAVANCAMVAVGVVGKHNGSRLRVNLVGQTNAYGEAEHANAPAGDCRGASAQRRKMYTVSGSELQVRPIRMARLEGTARVRGVAFCHPGGGESRTRELGVVCSRPDTRVSAAEACCSCAHFMRLACGTGTATATECTQGGGNLDSVSAAEVADGRCPLTNVFGEHVLGQAMLLQTPLQGRRPVTSATSFPGPGVGCTQMLSEPGALSSSLRRLHTVTSQALMQDEFRFGRRGMHKQQSLVRQRVRDINLGGVGDSYKDLSLLSNS
ncbi:hypothetical protein B0H10DRAFT_1942555 [Mycena sp. CBHHK59/15]|nr:hypothetical protein B0H10DRAFT_1942555 [Mycena sp. CBHHK59/15]